MQQLDISLDSIGYKYSRQLLDFNHFNSQLTLPSESVCHYYDILIHDPTTEGSSKLYEQFKHVITSPTVTYHQIAPPTSRKREFVKNNERRQYLLDEFIKTEANYLKSLKTFVSSIVEPLRQRSKDRQRVIIGHFECINIFMNIEELVQVTQDFYNDLIQYDPAKQSLGDLCLSHMRRFTCYNRFLLGVHNAQIINEKQMKNPSYFHFLEKAVNNQRNGNQTVYDYLALPSQRVGRYTMYFKELMKHTTDDDPDLPGLHGSLLKAEEIANMTEEIHTQLMKIFRRLLQSIQYCPESLISFQRRFLCYLDVAEIDSHTMKPIQPVTLFLFSDKVMIVKRPSYEADGLDLCGLDQRMYEGSERKDFYIRKEAIVGKLKFIGWISLSEIDIYDGPIDNPLKPFTLVCNSTGPLLSSPDTDQTTQRSLEAYFQHDQQEHSFALQDGGNTINIEYFQTLDKTKSHFIHQFGKSKNDIKQSDELIQSSYCRWNQHHFFANIYPTSNYHQVSNKNEIALFYIEKNVINIEAILSNCFVVPNMVGFIVPHEKEDNYRFAIRSKCAIGNTSYDEISLLTFRSNDAQQLQNAQNQLFGNLLACDRDLSLSAQLASDAILQQQQKQPQPLSTNSNGNSNSRFSMVKQESILKKSKSTFKLFSSLANNSQHHHHKQQKSSKRHSTPGITANHSPTTTISSTASIARPKTTSTYSEYLLSLDTYNSSMYHSSSSTSSSIHSANSIKSQHSNESRLKLQSLASNNNNNTISTTGVTSNKEDSTLLSPHQSSLHRIASKAASVPNMVQPRYFSPSFHPSRTVSYEIQSAATNRLSDENPYSYLPHSTSPVSSARMENNRSRSPLSFREPTPAMTEPGSESSTIASRCSPTISTINNPLYSHRHYYQVQDHSPQHHRLTGDHTRSLSDLIIPIATPTNDFPYAVSSENFKRSSFEADIYLELEEKNKTVLMLTSLLQKKEEEIDMLKADLEDSVSELGTICDKFNSELDSLAAMYKQDEDSSNNQDQPDRPSNPSPDTQLKRKLEMTLRERNQWQYRATELEHQFRLMFLNEQHHQNSNSKLLNNSRFNQHRRHSSSHGAVAPP